LGVPVLQKPFPFVELRAALQEALTSIRRPDRASPPGMRVHRQVTRTPWSYQRYLRVSRGEFSIAKHAYVSTRCGWFSDRSSGYLASGRLVIGQDTGFSRFLPCGTGLLPFETPEEAVAAIRRLREDYDEQCGAARHIAEEFFDARLVLTDLLERSL
jgi:hypothetical protein